MPKPELQEFARQAAKASAPANTVGQFVELIDEGDEVYTYLFETKQKGYVGWRWSVTVFDGLEEPSVSEVLLMPGPDSLVAPNWVPWSERLADWKALQAELERQAAEEAAAEDGEDADEDGDEDSDEADDDFEDVDESSEDSDDEDQEDGPEDGPEAADAVTDQPADEASDEAAELAVADLEPGEDAEADTGKARKRIPRFIRRRGRKNKDSN